MGTTSESVKPTSATLTVILANYGPLLFEEPITHRSVQIELTADQLSALELRLTHGAGGVMHYESISTAFLEGVEGVDSREMRPEDL